MPGLCQCCGRPIKKSRTTQQNKSLHKYFSELSLAFNEAGLDVKKVLSQNIEHPWTPNLVKELIWRQVQISYLNKKSTTELTTKEVTEIYDIINKYLGEKFCLHVEWPCVDTLMLENLN